MNNAENSPNVTAGSTRRSSVDASNASDDDTCGWSSLSEVGGVLMLWWRFHFKVMLRHPFWYFGTRRRRVRRFKARKT